MVISEPIILSEEYNFPYLTLYCKSYVELDY